MNINLPILYDELKSNILKMNNLEDIELTLAYVRLFSEEMTEIRKDCLYVVEPQYVDSFLKQHSTISIATINSKQVSLPEKGSWIVFHENISMYQLLYNLQQIFEKYQKWKDDIYQAIIENKPLQDILEVCSKLLINPIGLFDTSYVLIAKAGNIQNHSLDKIWAEVMEQGYFSPQNHVMSDSETLWRSRSPYLYHDGKVTKVQTCIRHQEQISGYLGATDLLEPFSLGQLSIIYAIQKIFESTLVLNSVLHNAERKTSSILERLLQGHNVEKSAVFYILSSLKWGMEDTFQLLYFYFCDTKKLQEDIIAPLVFHISIQLPDAKVYAFEEGIVAICHQPSEAVGDYQKILFPILSKQEMAVIISEPFQPFTYLRYAYLQCRMAMSITQPSKKSGLWSFSSIYERYILQSLSNTASLKALCHPYILSLSQKKRGKEFIQSLKVYIMNGRSISDTARQLYVHRNTLIYRLEQIETELDINFKMADEKTLFYLYFSCLIAESLYLDT